MARDRRCERVSVRGPRARARACVRVRARQTKGCDAAIMMKGFCQTGAATDKHRTDGGQTMRTPAATRI